MSDWKVGDCALAQSPNDGHWYPAIIHKIKGEYFRVRYDLDGSEVVVEEGALNDYDLFAGQKGAECWNKNNKTYYPVQIIDVRSKDEQARIKWGNGSSVWVDYTHLRFRNRLGSETSQNLSGSAD